MTDDLGSRYFERVTADRDLTPEDEDMILDLVQTAPLVRVRVCRAMCSTCIFRPSSVFQVSIPERIAEMVAAAEHGAHVPCHSTIDYDDVDDDGQGPGCSVLDDGPAAICKGMADRHPPLILQLAQRLPGACVVEVDVEAAVTALMCRYCGARIVRNPGHAGRYAFSDRVDGTDVLGSGSECPKNERGHEPEEDG